MSTKRHKASMLSWADQGAVSIRVDIEHTPEGATIIVHWTHPLLAAENGYSLPIPAKELPAFIRALTPPAVPTPDKE